MIPEIDCIKSDVRFLDGSFTPWAERINHLAQNEEYIHSVALIASTYAAEGHKVPWANGRHLTASLAVIISLP